MAITMQHYGDESSSREPVYGLDLDAYRTGQMNQRVLVIDDDAETVLLLKLLLRRAGYDVMGAVDGNEALRKHAVSSPDLVLLDLMMPGMDGYETMKRLRLLRNTPVICLSAKNAKEDVVAGLHAGADDYITKPFHDDELLARIDVVLKRVQSNQSSRRLLFHQTGLVVDMDASAVFLNGVDCELTRQEFALCALLAQWAGQVLPHEEIARQLWGMDSRDARNRIKYLVYLLRRKLETDYRNPQLVLSRGGIGYMLAAQPSMERK